ncbi:tetratricopeptide repeat protein [Aquabacter spiritensis]|uniref:Tfp pilus assembly protein PilF n=1 Tax=Aquabacter spiritensis TaxID=933073 RepID=A0A4R3LVM9_9HYPH|nr:tetratricopeptide repeat protein [Aquabacter spiritensis]TCT04641.1 Tfp pilus assembly protein PilF [Aquabacter spiritensis]
MPPDPRALLAEAAALHRAGQSEAAIDGLRRVTAAHPGFADAHRMLAMALLQIGRGKDAVHSARSAATLAPQDPHAVLLLGVVLQAAGQPEKALAQFDKVAKHAPAFAEAHFQAGNALTALGRFKEAAARYSRALDLDPRSVEALANRAVTLARLKLYSEALADFDRLIALQPWMPWHQVNKGSLLLEMRDNAGAVAAAQKALEAAPRDPDALSLLGQARFAVLDLPGAREAFAQAVDAAPMRPDIRVPYAQVLRRLEVLPEAIAQCDAALALDPRLVGALYERGEAKRAAGDPNGALADIDAALALAPRHIEAAVARSYILADLGRMGEMRPVIERALKFDPMHADAVFHRGMEDLATGHWVRGWEGYEARARIVPPTYVPLPFKRWDGSETPDHLVVLGEQGFGDAIQFARLVPLLAERGFSVTFQVSAPLVPLMGRLHPGVSVVSDLAGLDLSAPGLRWVPLGSLPHLLAADPALWPSTPYLSADPDRVRQWRHVREAGDLVIGITWQGSTRRDLDVGRSAPLQAFAPLAALPGVKLVAIQRNAGAEQVDTVSFKGKILRLDADFDADGAFLDTAALLQHLDAVVTTDTSMAHLAGALARPAIVALKAVPDWRWGREGEASVFYPALTLVRQAKPGMWDGVFETIAEMVRRRAAAAATPADGGTPQTGTADEAGERT